MNKLLQRVLAQNPRIEPFLVDHVCRLPILHCCLDKDQRERGHCVHQTMSRMQWSLRFRIWLQSAWMCHWGYMKSICFFMVKRWFFFARSFASSMFSSLTTLFALMGFQQIRDAMQMSSRRLSRRILWPSLLRNLSSPKQQIPHLKRRGSGLMNLNFDSSICLWLSKVLFFGMKCSVFGRSFSGMII